MPVKRVIPALSGSEAIRRLAERFPQLYLAPTPGRSQSEAYRSVVRRGKRPPETLSHFIGSPEDRLWVEETPVGPVTVLFLKHRADFECCYRIMACRCEPKEVPDCMGAATISGINDWSAIRAHLDAWEATGMTGRDAEFRRFTADPKNYKASLILLSDGNYSAVDASRTPYPPEEWLRHSFIIRLHHELTHFVFRKKLPAFRHPVLEELLADCVGLVFAVGRYDAALARAFLGIGIDGGYRGGRLENYAAPEQCLSTLAQASGRLIDELEARFGKCTDGYALMLAFVEEAPAVGENQGCVVSENSKHERGK